MSTPSQPARLLALHDAHAALGASFGVRGGAELVLRHAPGAGAVAAELAVVTGSAGLVDRSYRGLALVTGKDARSYLHGMVTCEVSALSPGQGAYGAVVTAKGKMLADLRLHVLSEEQLLVELPPEGHAATLEHLARYLVSEEAELGDATGQLVILGLVGPEAGRALSLALGAPPPEGELRHEVRLLAGAEVIVAVSSPEGLPGFDLLVNPAGAAAVHEQLLAAVRAVGGGPAGDDALEAARIEHFVPRFGTDMTEETIPLEANLDAAISYTKGCYIGQEVIARATYRGAVTRRLAKLEVPPGTRPGAQLFVGEKSVARLTSVLDPHPAGGPSLALGFVRRDQLLPGARLRVEGGPGEAVILAVPPPRPA